MKLCLAGGDQGADQTVESDAAMRSRKANENAADTIACQARRHKSNQIESNQIKSNQIKVLRMWQSAQAQPREGQIMPPKRDACTQALHNETN
jgi:hypothetical protein